MTSISNVKFFLMLAAVLTMLGCQQQRRPDYESLGLVPVTGTVRMDGQPLSGINVIFENENGGFSHGKTNELGIYRLMYTSEQPGVTPGKKTVRITSLPVGEVEHREGAATGDLIPARYNVQSKQIVEVSTDQQSFDFDLEGNP